MCNPQVESETIKCTKTQREIRNNSKTSKKINEQVKKDNENDTFRLALLHSSRPAYVGKNHCKQLTESSPLRGDLWHREKLLHIRKYKDNSI